MIYNEKGEAITFVNGHIVKTPKPNSKYREPTPEYIARAKAKAERELLEEKIREDFRLKSSAERLAYSLEDKEDNKSDSKDRLNDLCKWHKRLFDV
jgi:hypothetical protein